METLISQLFAARDTAHLLHLKSRSFAKHLALNDLYDALLEAADSIAEVYQGKYGIMNIPNPMFAQEESDPIMFVQKLATWVESVKGTFNPVDTHLLNEWDSLISVVYRAKYKLENLQ
jgi:hypothetical protein